MSIMTLTQDKFKEFKADYQFYGTHLEKDKYRNEQSVKNDTPRCTVNTMWHPMTDAVSVAEYGRDIASMYFAIVYDNPGIQHNDVVTLFGDDYEVVGVKHFNTHDRVDVKKKAA